MATIKINEISQDYTYNVGTSTFATVALPITSSWGPGYTPESAIFPTTDITESDGFDSVVWSQFAASQTGLEAFVKAYRGPVSNYKYTDNYSYQMALSLLSAGYDILVCRVATGTAASNTLDTIKTVIAETGSESTKTYTILTATLNISAKYTGTFGNNISVSLKHISGEKWNVIVSIVNKTTNTSTAVENFTCTLTEGSSDYDFIEELDSSYAVFNLTSSSTSTSATKDGTSDSYLNNVLSGGTDIYTYSTSESDDNGADAQILKYIEGRYGNTTSDYYTNVKNIVQPTSGTTTKSESILAQLATMETVYYYANILYTLLEDKLNYSPQRIISPGWDDQRISIYTNSIDMSDFDFVISPFHATLMNVAYHSRCGTSLIDIPKDMPRSKVYTDSEVSSNTTGYAQMLSKIATTTSLNVDSDLYPTHSALFAPWGTYKYTTMTKQTVASPSFIALLIQRAMVLNQSIQYEWILPTSRKHSLNIGKLDYKISKKYLDEWQKLEGVGVNVITAIADLGTSLWGNSTLYDVPVGTYQALANLSTRYLVNAIENIAYKCGVSITYNYNNNQAYDRFYVGVTPTLDSMKNVGAIEAYSVTMSADIDGLDQVNANSVIGTITIVPVGVINNITVDLIALPPGSSLTV